MGSKADGFRTHVARRALTSDSTVHASAVLFFEATKWLRNLLAVIGLLTVIVLLTSRTSSRGSLELRVGKETSTASAVQVATPPRGLVILPVDSP